MTVVFTDQFVFCPRCIKQTALWKKISLLLQDINCNRAAFSLPGLVKREPSGFAASWSDPMIRALGCSFSRLSAFSVASFIANVSGGN